MKITKMNGIGNDFFIVDGISDILPNLDFISVAPRWCHRQTGLGNRRKGADGIALLLPSEKADFYMKIINADGSEPEMCGNAIRCVAAFARSKGLVEKDSMHIDTLSGVKQCDIKNNLVKVDMGEPTYQKTEIIVVKGRPFTYQYVSMGNPHAVIFVPNSDRFPVAHYGPSIEKHSDFPNQTNVEFVQVLSPGTIKVRVWERGVGETLACGTGACATVVAGVLQKKLERRTKVSLRGGDLFIEWDAKTNHVFMTGAAEEDFELTVHLN